MNPHVTAFNLGNADSTLVQLNSGKVVLIDYANTKTEDPDDLRCDLPKELNSRVQKDHFDVVAFTHADLDHVKGFADYFYLEHAAKYQGGDRKKITDLWVPANVILEQGCEDESRILREEARYRLRERKGVKIFSAGEKLKAWLEKEKIPYEDVKHLIVHAGSEVPGWDSSNSELSVLALAPFAYTIDEDTEIDRNDACLVLQLTFGNTQRTRCLMLADANWELLHEIVSLSERFNSADKLDWDILHIAHHISYLSLSPEKGETQTEPVDPVRKLMEEHSRKKCIMIAPSNPVPSSYDTQQPPHRQAYNYYQSVAALKEGELQVTMSFPSEGSPKPMEIVINNYGATLLKTVVTSSFVTDRKPPKAG
jgi:hypothetical protein